MFFSGILNENGIEKTLHIYLDLDLHYSYIPDAYIDYFEASIQINKKYIKINDIEYEYEIKFLENETLFVGKETFAPKHYLFCFCRPNFFVLTNKQEV